MFKLLTVSFLILFLLLPTVVLGMEQTFTQQDTRVIMKLEPDLVVPGKEVTLSLRLEKAGRVLTDRVVTVEVYREGAEEPFLEREAEPLEGDYLESWTFDEPGAYRVAVTVEAPEKPQEALRYEVKAAVQEQEPQQEKHRHGFMGHHFGGTWGWIGGGAMLVMMVTMMVLL